MLEQNAIISPEEQEEIGDSVSREEIADHFCRHFYLEKEYLNALKRLSAREAFDLLVSARPDFYSLAIDLMKEFPEPETIELLLELRQNPKYATEIRTIDWILFQFTHQAEVSQAAIDTLKELGDPRVILENEVGKFEMVTELAFDKVVSLVPTLADQPDFLLKSLREGAVFTLRTKDDKLASVAVAHQQPSHILYLDYIYTADDKRGEGHAAELIEYLLEHHVVLQCDLFRGDMLSEKILKRLGFIHTGPGEKWTYQVKE